MADTMTCTEVRQGQSTEDNLGGICSKFQWLLQVVAVDTVQERPYLTKEFGAVPINVADMESAFKVVNYSIAASSDGCCRYMPWTQCKSD